MKRSVLLMALAFILSLALLQAQDKATISSYRVLPKTGKDAALKKALTDHGAKYHSGTWKWRVFKVLSGPDAGAYQINEGPNSWTELEGRKDISDDHIKDYDTNVQPLVEREVPDTYLRYQRELSSDSAVGPLKKALLRHFYPKPGKGPRLFEYFRTWKKVWEKMGLRVAVWSTFYSGEPQFVVASRLPQGWVDLERPLGPEMRNTFDEFAGVGAYARFMEDLDQYTFRIFEEMIEFLPEASSK